MTRALTRPRSRCDEDHRLGVMVITSPFDAVATNGMTQGRPDCRLWRKFAVLRPYPIKGLQLAPNPV